MTTAAKSLRARRHHSRALEQEHHTARPSLAASLVRAATSRPAKAAYIVIGTIGLTALAVAIIGPKRIEQEVLRPIRGRARHEAERLWNDSQPLRDQIGSLFNAAGAERERLVRSFQSWIGHFHAS